MPTPDMDQAEPRFDHASLIKMGSTWAARIEDAEKRERKWLEDASLAESIFSSNDQYEAPIASTNVGQKQPLNLLFSSVSTVVPATYNSTPRPDVRPRHNNPDPGAKDAADVFERAIAALIDDDRLTNVMEGMAQDAYLAGRGVPRIKYEPILQEVLVQGEDGQPQVVEALVDETVVYETVSWRNYREGPATKWANVPWVAYRESVSSDELAAMTDPDIDEMRREAEADAEAQGEETKEKVHDVWQIWDKGERKVYVLCQSRIVSVQDDPLGLKGFFPQPAPVQPIGLSDSRTPICPYAQWKDLDAELNKITRRINSIIGALKTRGLAAGDIADEVSRWAAADDGEVIVARDMAASIASGTSSGGIAWWPVEQQLAVLSQLYAHRNEVKALIYEITGISDIVRGASDARETRGAQEFKVNFANLRVRRMIRQIEGAARSLFHLTSEVLAGRFQPQNVARLAGVPLTPELEQILAKPFDHFRIDVETNSTVQADRSQARGEMAEFIQATAGYMQVASGITQQNPLAAVPLAEMYGAFARQFSLGKQAEDAVDELIEGARQMALKQAQGGQPADPRVLEAQAKAARDQAELHVKQQQLNADIAKAQADAQIKLRELALKEAQVQIEAQKLGFEAERLNMTARAQQADQMATAFQLQQDAQKQRADAERDKAELYLEATQGRPVGIGR